jgi:threonine/homoserine/homoserine lactone efflux protein
LVLSALAFASVGFTSVSLWTLFGAGIRRYLNRPKVRRTVNIALALLLVYTAVDISGVLKLLQQ